MAQQSLYTFIYYGLTKPAADVQTIIQYAEEANIKRIVALSDDNPTEKTRR